MKAIVIFSALFLMTAISPALSSTGPLIPADPIADCTTNNKGESLALAECLTEKLQTLEALRLSEEDITIEHVQKIDTFERENTNPEVIAHMTKKAREAFENYRNTECLRQHMLKNGMNESDDKRDEIDFLMCQVQMTHQRLTDLRL